jgi:hypothetical protein
MFGADVLAGPVTALIIALFAVYCALTAIRVGNVTGPLPAEGRLRVPVLAAAIYPRTARPAWATSMSWV